MSSIVEICNLALSHVGGYSIQALTDTSKEGRECKRLYDPARDATLEAGDWGFARKRQALALLSGETFAGWDYAYSWPSDCVIPRKIYDATVTSLDPSEEVSADPEGIPFEIGVNDGLNKRVILTNEEDAVLIYTAKVVDANLYTAGFCDALSFRLASDLAIPLRSDSKLQQNMLQQFRIRVGEVGAAIANAEHRKPETGSSYERAR